MKNKVAYRMMLERLNSRAWEENDERVVAEVQKIAKLTENKEFVWCKMGISHLCSLSLYALAGITI
ncbi:hypothetical protein [Enterococcus durans]|uniref:hypothetical protein n=1 Tax=Enterococcus durans TaxID=53345 RepID=UPI0011BFEF88|nr:hypothetical protein [Enterococcus durans]QED60842.1 hypothetical protein FS851_14345 [Enterococcus durans]